MVLKNWKTNRASNGLSGFAGGLDRDAARVDDAQVRGLRRIDRHEPPATKQSGDLLAFVLVDFTAERLNPESSHE